MAWYDGRARLTWSEQYLKLIPVVRRCSIGRKITFLYTNIGRGHPFYLDGIAEALSRSDSHITRVEANVFEISTGLSGFAWRLVRWLYQRGSSNGLAGALYSRFRRNVDFNKRGPLLGLVGRSLLKWASEQSVPVIVAHPLLVAILRGKADLIYQHGERVCPSSAAIGGADMVLVPTQEAAGPFLEAGYASNQVQITGLCIEPALTGQAEPAFQARVTRLANDGPLTGL
ncbi:MAG: hypothetical protein DRP45_05970, partial [Candidatus Zixiibacteriota bacterium]